MSEFKPEGSEKDWLGPQESRENQYLVYHNQTNFFTSDLLALETDYSEFSVRLHDPQLKSLSFINRTLAILPKSKLRAIYSLIGEYLDTIDKR